MDELVRRLRSMYWTSSGINETCTQAADAIGTLAAALEGLVAAVVECDDEGRISDSAEMRAARAALREVGRG